MKKTKKPAKKTKPKKPAKKATNKKVKKFSPATIFRVTEIYTGLDDGTEERVVTFHKERNDATDYIEITDEEVGFDEDASDPDRDIYNGRTSFKGKACDARFVLREIDNEGQEIHKMPED